MSLLTIQQWQLFKAVWDTHIIEVWASRAALTAVHDVLLCFWWQEYAWMCNFMIKCASFWKKSGRREVLEIFLIVWFCCCCCARKYLRCFARVEEAGVLSCWLEQAVCNRGVVGTSLYISILTVSPLLVPGVPLFSRNNVFFVREVNHRWVMINGI